VDIQWDELKQFGCEEIVTEKEKFAGAKATYTIESLMHDGKALQTGTSHNFGTNFSKAFDIKFLDRNGKWQYVHQTSWGVSTRMIGGLIMVHSDNNGLVMPPKVAPVQVVIVPIAQHKEGVLAKATELQAHIQKVARVKIDASNKTPGWKFNDIKQTIVFNASIQKVWSVVSTAEG
ncbi:His/Gly/Thr/Pro-type tRNA ligase C-terminal domain-containing protein, partial [Bacillus sp. SS-TM]